MGNIVFKLEVIKEEDGKFKFKSNWDSDFKLVEKLGALEFFKACLLKSNEISLNDLTIKENEKP